MSGDIRLRAECLLPEQLIRRALDAGATFGRIERSGEKSLLLDTDPAGAGIILALCQRFSIPAALVRRKGFSAGLEYLKRRATLMAGLLLCALLCAVFLGRIWLIDIAFTGEHAGRGDPAFFRRALDQMDVRPGSFCPDDVGIIAKELEAASEDCSFVDIRRQGVRLILEAAPESPAPKVYDVEAARDLYSACDGIVVSAEARSGTLCVSPGDTVRRGQLLIRGEEKATADGTRPIAALGEVVVRTWFPGESELPATREKTEYTGRSAVVSRLRIAGWGFPIVECDGFESQTEEAQVLAVGGLFLPVEIVRTTLRETRKYMDYEDPAAIKERLIALAGADARLQLSAGGPADGTVDRTWTSIVPSSGAALRARTVYEIRTNAAVTREVLLQGG